MNALSKQPLLAHFYNFLLIRSQSSSFWNLKCINAIWLLRNPHKNTLEQLQVICSELENFKFRALWAEQEVINLRQKLTQSGNFKIAEESRKRTKHNFRLSLL